MSFEELCKDEKMKNKIKKTFDDRIGYDCLQNSLVFDGPALSGKTKEEWDKEFEIEFVEEMMKKGEVIFTNIPPNDSSVFYFWKLFHWRSKEKSDLDLWKEFYETFKSDHVFFVVDGRDYDFFYESDIEGRFDNPHWEIYYETDPVSYIPQNKLTIVVNKSDLINERIKAECRKKFKNVIFYSATCQKKSENPILKFMEKTDFRTFGMIGYPTVGKSSIIKSLLNQTESTKLEISKFSETLWIGEKKLINCQGVIFARYGLRELYLRKIIETSSLKPEEYFFYIFEKVGVSSILDLFECNAFKSDSKNNIKESLLRHLIKKTKKNRKKIINLIIEAYFGNKLKISEELDK